MADYLYVHIPFCPRKCIYCDFLSLTFDEVLADRYVHALCAELQLRRSSAGTLRTVYIGGGTPSVLSPGAFSRVFTCLRENYRIAPSAEITVEVNPGTVTADGLGNMRDLGINRISMGVQSLDDRELAALGRIHSAAEAASSVRLIRDAGFPSLSVDLMYGIPGQGLESWKETLRRAVDLGPGHISAYELTPEKGTPLARLLGSGALVMPHEDMIIEMFNEAGGTLAEAGLAQYEISNYARDGYRCIHNINYWDRGEYIGAGAGAHSFVDGFRSRNTGNLESYIARLERLELPLGQSTRVEGDEAVRETVFLGLRKTEGLRLSRPLLTDREIPARCSDLIAEGYLESDGDIIRLTGKGMIVSNEIMVRIFERLGL